MTAEEVLAFRLERSGLAQRARLPLSDALPVPASDFVRGSTLLSIAARVEDVDRESFETAVDTGEVTIAHLVRGAIHAAAGHEHALWGRTLLSDEPQELTGQLGKTVERLLTEHRIEAVEALGEVADATAAALADGRRLDLAALHAELRERVRSELQPWCRGCASHHVAPMLWRIASVKSGARLDSDRRYTLGGPGRTPAATSAVRRFIAVYGPTDAKAFANWAGLARPHADRVWTASAGDLVETDHGWVLAEDSNALAAPAPATGIRLLPPGDPYLQTPNRALLATDADLRKRLFRPVASPGAVLRDGRLAGLWRARARGRRTEVTVEKLERLPRRDVEREAKRVARLRGAVDVDLVL